MFGRIGVGIPCRFSCMCETHVPCTVDTANALEPAPILRRTLPVGKLKAGVDAVHPFRYDTPKSRKILGIEYRTMQETTKDTLEGFEAVGWESRSAKCWYYGCMMYN
jgi:hypothetical protein